MLLIYGCEYCDKQFLNYEMCQKHEANHIKPKRYAEQRIYCYTQSEGAYPDVLYVPMTDGETVIYKFQSIEEEGKL